MHSFPIFLVNKHLSRICFFSYLPSLLRTTMPSYLQDPKVSTPTAFSKLDRELPASVSTLYLAGLVGIFVFAALLHPSEAYCLVHGFWYLLCLPSGYLLLIVYSVCNITDRSWGTREEKTTKSKEEWYETLWKNLRYIFTCCCKQSPTEPSQGSPNELSDPSNSPTTSKDYAILPQQNQDVVNPTTLEAHELETDYCDYDKEYAEFWENLRKAYLPPESQISGGVGKRNKKLTAQRRRLKDVQLLDLEKHNYDNGDEHNFWEDLRKKYLLPESQQSEEVAERNKKLTGLRDFAVIVFAVTNAIWIVSIITLLNRTELNFLGTHVLGLAFLCIYGVLVILQFLTLLWHRLITMSHLLARASWTPDPLQMNCACISTNLLQESGRALLNGIGNIVNRLTERCRRRRCHSNSESQRPMVCDQDHQQSYTNDAIDQFQHDLPCTSFHQCSHE